jgi:hypothetical protein
MAYLAVLVVHGLANGNLAGIYGAGLAPGFRIPWRRLRRRLRAHPCRCGAAQPAGQQQPQQSAPSATLAHSHRTSGARSRRFPIKNVEPFHEPPVEYRSPDSCNAPALSK